MDWCLRNPKESKALPIMSFHNFRYPTTSQEILFGQGEECAGSDSSANSHWPLVIGEVPEEDQEATE